MNTPNNKRKKESMERIEKVFIELLQTREVSEISISDICKRARLNRTTFYSNYTDIYGLADTIRNNLENNLAELYRDEITRGFNSNNYLKLFTMKAKLGEWLRTALIMLGESIKLREM